MSNEDLISRVECDNRKINILNRYFEPFVKGF